MKKLLLAILSLTIVATFCLSSFAFYGMNNFEPSGGVDQSDLAVPLYSGDYDSEVITTRNDWTPNRAENAGSDNSVIVEGVEGNDTQCVKINKYFTLFPDSTFSGDYFVSVDMKPVTITSFTGMLFDYTDGSSSSTDNPHPNAHAATRDRTSEHDYEYPLYTGYGYTFVAGKTTSVRLFVNASKTGLVDKVDIDLGFDYTQGWHNYAMYVDTAATRAYFYVDKTLKAYFDFSGGDGAVYNALGEAILTGTNNFFGNKTACLSFVGESIEVYFDNLEVNNWTSLPASSNVKLVGASFDTILIDGTMASFQATDGNASDALDTVGRKIDNKKSTIKEITLRGWAGFDAPVESFGYRIGTNKAVFGEFKEETSQDVLNAGGEYASRFAVTVPVENLQGTQEVVVVAKFANGTTVDIIPETGDNCPDTSFTVLGKEILVNEYTDGGHGSCMDSSKFFDKNGAEIAEEDEDYDDLGEITKMAFKGWVGFNDDYIDSFGYMVDSLEPVFSGTKTDVAADDPVRDDANGGEYAARFGITFNYSSELGLYDGEHEVRLVAKLANGDVYFINEDIYTFTVTGNPAPTKDPSATDEPTATPEVTDAPADATDAPSDTTDAPAATEEPKDDDSSEKKSGCGSIIGGGIALGMAIALVVIKKKH